MRAIIKGDIRLINVPEKISERLKEQLTCKNPKYEQVMRYSKYANTRVPRYIEYFKSTYDPTTLTEELVIPIGTDLSTVYSHITDITDERVTCPVKFPEFTMTLRETQEEAFNAYVGAINERHFGIPDYKSCIQLPTGKGKTILGLKIASHLKVRTLIIVHKTDLVEGWLKDIDNAFSGKADTGIIKAQKRRVGEHFTIATVQTLNRLTQKDLNKLYKSFGLIIQDEMHHCPSTSFSIGNNFYAMYRLGLTATPERSDGLTHVMKLYYGDFCYKYQHKADDKDILPVEVKRRKLDVFFDPILFRNKGKLVVGDLNSMRNFDPETKLNKGEVRASKLDRTVRPQISHLSVDKAVTSNSQVVKQVTEDIIKEFESGHSCIVFFRRVESVELYADILMSRGVPESKIGLYYGGNRDCDSVLNSAEKNRAFITLATYSKATEGTNVKQWEVAFLVSSLNNGKDVEQAVGRIRRSYPDGEKLSTAVVYDYRYDNCFQLSSHGFTRDLRYRTLKFDNNKPKKTGLFSRGYKNNT